MRMSRRELIGSIPAVLLTKRLDARTLLGQSSRPAVDRLMSLTIPIDAADDAVTLPDQVVVAAGYNNLTNWPGASNRPVTTGEVLNWIGPSAGGPSAANDVAQSVTLKASGRVTLAAGQTISGLDISGTITAASNATLKRCRVRTGSAYSLVSIPTRIANFVMEDCEIDGVNGSTDGASAINPGGGVGVLGSGCIIRRCNIHGVCNGISFGEGPLHVIDNWINSLATSSSGHMNGIQYNGGAGNAQINIQHNTIENTNNQTDCIMLDDYYGTVQGVTINNNLLRGGGAYTLYLDCHFNNTTPSNVVVTNNAFQITSPYYAAGYHDFNPNYPNVFTGNYDFVTSAPVT
jgi:hypothetical protein